MSDATQFATARDFADSLAVTYNGMPCQVAEAVIGPIRSGEPLRMRLEVLLPKGWDQGHAGDDE